MAGAAAHVVVPSVSASLELAGEDSHHLESVLRLRPGEEVGATDGQGWYVLCVYGGKGRLTAVGEPVFTPRATPALTVGFVPVKGDKPEWTVQKLAELGVDRIVVLRSDRSVVRWDGDRAEGHLGRLRRVVRGAVMQSRQVWMPVVEGVTPVKSAVGPAVGSVSGGGSASGGGGVGVADMGGGPLPADVHTVVVGPEGGWSAEEREAFAVSGAAVVSLGPTVLRAETAAVAAGVLLTARRAGLGS